jgi:hypothetical protein
MPAWLSKKWVPWRCAFISGVNWDCQSNISDLVCCFVVCNSGWLLRLWNNNTLSNPMHFLLVLSFGKLLLVVTLGTCTEMCSVVNSYKCSRPGLSGVQASHRVVKGERLPVRKHLPMQLQYKLFSLWSEKSHSHIA